MKEYSNNDCPLSPSNDLRDDRTPSKSRPSQ